MKSIIFVGFFACLAFANAGVIVAPASTKTIQGPSTRTTVVGPDGSSISSVSPGGSIVHEETAGILAETAPVIASAPAVAYAAAPVAYSAHATPTLAYSSGPIAYSAYAPPTLTYSAAPIAYSGHVVSTYGAPLTYSVGVVAEKQLDTLISGPSGTIATSKTVHRPAIVAEPHVYAAGAHAYYI